jgi:hypothetical protein
MTITENISEFDLKYDAGSKGAPDIDNYEKSVYMTAAQEEIVKAYYSGENKSRKGFENSEKRRRTMSELVTTYSQTSNTKSSRGIVKDSVFFAIPTNVFYIVNEQVIISSKTDPCLNGKAIMVKPITHDDFLRDYQNPFRKPNSKKAWRLDLSKTGANPLVEIVSPYELSEYKMRYVKAPRPIILTDLTAGDFAGLGLTINGETSPQACLLNSEIHREILNRAVELAIRDYRENNLRTQIETNNRV